MHESRISRLSPRGRLAAAAALFTLTLTLGVAARQTPDRATPDAPPAPPAHASSGAVSMDVHLDRASVLKGEDGTVRMELVLRGAAANLDDAARVPTDLVVVLDRSGSMQGQPIEMARASVHELIAGLAPEDRFALVSYANGARTDVPLSAATQAARDAWSRALDGIAAGGGTNMSSGLDLAQSLVGGFEGNGRATRVILLSDGHANQGDHSLDGLRSRARRAVSQEYVLSAVGIGSGFDETVMSTLADAGTGNFYYLPNLAELAGIFADEFAAARETVASAVRITFTPGGGVDLRDAGGYPLQREARGVSFHPGSISAGQERRIWLTLRAPTERPGDVALGALTLRYNDAAGRGQEIRLAELPQLACVAGEEDYYASFDTDVYRRSSSELLGSLKQRVAAKLKAGRQAEAVGEIQAELEALEANQLRALGYVVRSDVDALRSLKDTVGAPAAAEPAMQNHLGKQLLEAGRDSRRAGAKR